MQIVPLYTLSGACVGFIVGLTGVGGGSLMTPILMLAFGVHAATAVGTDLLYAAVTKSVGAGVHSLRGNVDWRIVGLMAVGSAPASAMTLFVLSQMNARSEQSSHLVSVTLGIALILTAGSIIFRNRLIRLRESREPPAPQRVAVITIAVGAALGCLVSLSSVGAGAVGMTALLLLYPSLPIVRIVGTDIAHAVPLTAIAGVGHWTMGSVNGSILVSLLIGSIPAIALGSRLAPSMPEFWLRFLLALILAVVGARLVFN